MKDYRELCLELFGTDDETELRKIAGRLRGGRKKALTQRDIDLALEMQGKGISTKEIANHFGVSRQTVSKNLNKPLSGDFVMRLDFMYKQKVCTEIYVDFEHRQIKIINRTNDIMKRAFGINEAPKWEDFEAFLEERCFPESRAMKKTILNKIGLDSYDPLQILELTKGRTAEDNQYIKFTRKRRAAF
ncbi:MAG: Hin recombinase [Ruminococcus sp.]|nr:Hin recombinase [Ruminococcus sp.]